MNDFYLEVSSPFSNQHFVNFALEDNSVILDYVDTFTSRQSTPVSLDWDFDSRDWGFSSRDWNFDSRDWDFDSTSKIEVNTSSTSSSSYIDRNFNGRDSTSHIEIKGVDWDFSVSSDGNTVDVKHHNLEKHEVQKIIKQLDSDGDGILEPSDLNNSSFSYRTKDKDNGSLYDIEVDVVID
ncbi:MAG: hypothetical protein Tsb0014_19560 [Pleurocapsa sp.]